MELKKLVDAEVFSREVDTRMKQLEDTERSGIHDLSKISEIEDDDDECVDAYTELNNFHQKERTKKL